MFEVIAQPPGHPIIGSGIVIFSGCIYSTFIMFLKDLLYGDDEDNEMVGAEIPQLPVIQQLPLNFGDKGGHVKLIEIEKPKDMQEEKPIIIPKVIEEKATKVDIKDPEDWTKKDKKLMNAIFGIKDKPKAKKKVSKQCPFCHKKLKK